MAKDFLLLMHWRLRLLLFAHLLRRRSEAGWNAMRAWYLQ